MGSESIGAPVPVQPAATVALLRDAAGALEVLLLRRQSALAFAAGMWVFPGGRIDAGDFGAPDDLFAAAQRAAVREAMEEAAVRVDPEALVYFAHWTTPADGRSRRRFATWFFVAGLDGGHAVQVDGGEIDDHQWIRPAAAIAAHRRCEMALMPPTYVALTEMAACASVADALAMYRGRRVLEIEPRLVAAPEFVSLYPGDVAYGGGDPQRPGPRHRSWMAADGLYYERDPRL